MNKREELKKHIKRGNVYRRADLIKWTKSVDRHLDVLLKEGVLQKLARGVYYFPKETIFGKPPPEEKLLVRCFLKDERFLLTSPNSYNSLGVGTTQLYNKLIVYNHKRHGEFKLGNRNFDFQIKHNFPTKLTQEFLLVDLVNNLRKLAEDECELLKNIIPRAMVMDRNKLKYCVSVYGNLKTKKILAPVIDKTEPFNYASIPAQS